MGEVQGSYKLVYTGYVKAVRDALDSRAGCFVNYGLMGLLHQTGQLTQNELFLQIGHFFSADSNVERLHNQLISAIHGNITRDQPEQGVAPWVSANDKPTVLSKPVVGDAAEQRLKMEVMQLPARDRRRLKEIPEVSHGTYSRRSIRLRS